MMDCIFYYKVEDNYSNYWYRIINTKTGVEEIPVGWTEKESYHSNWTKCDTVNCIELTKEEAFLEIL